MADIQIQFNTENYKDIRRIIALCNAILPQCPFPTPLIEHNDPSMTATQREIEKVDKKQFIPILKKSEEIDEVEPTVEKKKRVKMSPEEMKQHRKEYMKRYFLEHPEKFNNGKIPIKKDSNVPTLHTVSPYTQKEAKEYTKEIEYAFCGNVNCMLSNLDHKFVKGTGVVIDGVEYHSRVCAELAGVL